MKRNQVFTKITALFSSGLMLSNIFQSYAYAHSVSKLTSIVYNSSKEVVSNGKLGKNSAINAGSGQANAQSSNDQNSSSSSVFSDAYNFKSLSQTVDPRTGAFSVSYKIGDISGNGFEDPEISLALNYTSTSFANSFSLGKGWSLNLSHYDTKTGMLSLASGGSYKLDLGKGKLKYYKLKDLDVKLGLDYITLTFKDGKVELIDRAYGNLRKITNVQGFSAEFLYEKGNRLSSVVYKNPVNGNDLKKLEINYPSDSEVQFVRNLGSEKAVTVIKKFAGGNILSSIMNPIGQEVKFEYKSSVEKAFPTDSLITSILYPTGTVISVSYLAGGLEAAKKDTAAPAVAKIKTISLPKTESSEEEISYNYYNSTSTNYLAKGFTGYKEGEDALFFTPNTYTYSTVEIKKAPDNQTTTVERFYNHFHQMIKEEVKLNGDYYLVKEFNYSDWLNKSFDNLNATYSFPREIKTTYYSNGSRRSEVIKQEFDDYGNITKTQDVNGIVKEFSYLPAEKTFHKMVNFPYREVEKSINGGGSKVIDYSYEDAKNNQGNSFQRLKARIYKISETACTLEDSNCGKVYKTEIHKYDNTDTAKNIVKTFGLPSVTKLYSAANGKCKVVQRQSSYALNNSQNIINVDYYAAKGKYLASESVYKNAYTKLDEKTLDKEGLEISSEYDILGRKTRESLKAPTSSVTLSKNYTYKVNDSIYGGYGTSALLVQSPNGYKSVIIYDSLGRELEIQKESIQTGKIEKIKSYVYGVTGQKIKEILYNNDVQGNAYKLELNYKYDVVGRNIASTSPSGETKYTIFNDVNRTETSFVQALNGEKSLSSITTYNEFKKPIRTQLFSPAGVFINESLLKYDNFGNISEKKDVNGNIVKYFNNILGQKIEEQYLDGRKIKYEYDEIFLDKVTKKTVILANSKEYVIGAREYNEKGLILKDIDPSGNAINYEYDNYNNLISEKTRSGKLIKYSYTPFNKIAKKEVSGDISGKYTTTYTYDPLTLNIIAMKDNNGITSYFYNSDSSVSSVLYPDNRRVSYGYNLQGSLDSIKDIQGNITRYHFSKVNGKLEASEFILATQMNNIQMEQYFYDNFSRIKSKILPNNAQTIYEYDDIGNLVSMTNKNEIGQSILKYDYTYRKDMNIASRTRTEEGDKGYSARESYSYDRYNNLISYMCSGTACPSDQNGQTISAEDYTFDGLNNIKTVKVAYANGTSSSTNYNYSAQDPSRLVGYSTTSSKGVHTANLEYDNDGNIIKDGEGNSLSYSPFNRLEAFVKDGNVTEYRYNGNGILISQKDLSTNEETKFYYNGQRIINESTNGSITSYFQVSGRVIGKLAQGKEAQYFITDQAQSVIRIFEGRKLLDTNYVYTPYGQQANLAENSNLAKVSGFGFNGERTDGKSGYQFLGQGYRAYNPALARFMQYDVHSPFGKGGLNGYTFAENNPIMKFDPSGESAASATMMGVGIFLAILGVALSVVTFGTSTGLIGAGAGAAAGGVGAAAGSAAATTALTGAQIGLATTSLIAGVASAGTGIASSIYEHKAYEARQAGDKDMAMRYAETATILGYISLALGIVSLLSGIGVKFAGSPKLGSTFYIDDEATKAFKPLHNARESVEIITSFATVESLPTIPTERVRNGFFTVVADLPDLVSPKQIIVKPPVSFIEAPSNVSSFGDLVTLFKELDKKSALAAKSKNAIMDPTTDGTGTIRQFLFETHTFDEVRIDISKVKRK
ncbi:RHS repeat-associated core domain-containing protein [Pigmentibacter ruber]|uniref:RHS repeat-associated core domain-containing protein n=1 Tax=Pigmentibacter ruber TaxID=2683196 RepID=UPI00131D4D30|nr:RHS repeat-associated core domain-containing protein [Pigmentibacter ruber]